MSSSGSEPIRGPVYQATLTCRESLTKSLSDRTLKKNGWSQLRLADFDLWVAGIGALAKERASLDHRLATKPDISAVVVALLGTLSATAADCRECGMVLSPKKYGHS
jgi:hypothetical protein